MKLAILKKSIPNRALVWLCVAALLVSLLPLYALAFYNHACYDDFGFSILTHASWRESGSFVSAFMAAVDNTLTIRHTWEGTYATSFISALQPALFGEDLYWVTTAVLLTFFLFSVWFLLHQVLVKLLHADRSTFWMAFCAMAFAMVQFVPELSEAFFWFNGGVAYTMMWSLMALRMGLWVSFFLAQKKSGKWLSGLLLLAVTIVMGGAKYSTVLLAALLDALIVAYAFWKKRRDRFADLFIFIVLMVCFVFSMVAPGNGVRAQTLMGGISAPKAILQAFYFGLALMGSWFSLPLMVVWAFVAWQLMESLNGCPYRFHHPVWVTVLSVCLFCAQLAPTLYTGNYIGDGRTVNTYFYTFVIMSCALVLYWVGWFMRRMESARSPFPAIGTAQKDGLRIAAFVIAVVLLIIGCVSYHPEGSLSYGPQNMASGSALRSILSGEAQAYDEAMTERDNSLADPDQADVILKPIENIPDAFMGDALESDNIDYVLNLYQEYYQKQSVGIAQEE